MHAVNICRPTDPSETQNHVEENRVGSGQCKEGELASDITIVRFRQTEFNVPGSNADNSTPRVKYIHTYCLHLSPIYFLITKVFNGFVSFISSRHV